MFAISKNYEQKDYSRNILLGATATSRWSANTGAGEEFAYC
jgi:hypothetical protein